MVHQSLTQQAIFKFLLTYTKRALWYEQTLALMRRTYGDTEDGNAMLF